MRLSDMISNIILEMLDEANGTANIKRNELAEQIGCVPSQINYVLTSRFTPEQGYIIESQRGGGGYVRIRRIHYDQRSAALMHVVNSIGSDLDESTCRNHINNLEYNNLISQRDAAMMLAAVSGACYREIPVEYRNNFRARIFKQMLLTSI